ncbi:type II secretion system protein GspH [Saccharobesus litoralis]|uniref:Type II secretion system protein H n=1 Tax=Saccharobesus litoralis TaxID=2172099 RepID=A0A2S0VWU7_9ALTE|nr:type II secretion system minor pseudopilin GspH [Saccharobesus litoralis]AWB68688.1 type II secretion system protein GspH [Saccharobesus litoralis]
MTKPFNKASKQQGFTLLEIMLVLVLMAILVSSISFSFDTNDPSKKVEKEARKFQALYHLAVEYALLNNVQFGVVINEAGYEFVGFDGQRWSPISGEATFAEQEMPENITLQLRVDNIPWLDQQNQEDDLFSSSDDEDTQKDEEDKVVPHIYLFSSGDITPFELLFIYDEAFSDIDSFCFSVTGEYAIPLKVEGPLEVDL